MIRINLIPREARPDRTVYYQLFIGVVAITLTVLFVLFWWFNLKQTNERLKVNIKNKEAELKKLEYVRKQVQKYQEKKALLLKKKETINNLQKIQRGPVLMLMELNRARPQNQVWFTNVQQVGDNLIKLRGTGLSYSSIGDFMNELAKRTIFKTVKLENSTKTKQGPRQVYKFSIHFNVNLKSLEGS